MSRFRYIKIDTLLRCFEEYNKKLIFLSLNVDLISFGLFLLASEQSINFNNT